MTKREKIIVDKAINEIMDEDGDFTGAIDSLCHLVGGCYPPAHVKTRRTTLGEIVERAKKQKC